LDIGFGFEEFLVCKVSGVMDNPSNSSNILNSSNKKKSPPANIYRQGSWLIEIGVLL